MTLYRFFDFTLDSDLSFPELEPSAGSNRVLVVRRSGAADQAAATARARWFHHVRSDDGRPWLSVGRLDSSYLLKFHSLLSIKYEPPRVLWNAAWGVSDASVRHLLLDQALPAIAAHEGDIVLHGACAILDERAVLFAGPAGAGKSTLLAHLSARGWRAAADDATALEIGKGGRVHAKPSYGGLRLWADSCEALNYGPGEAVSQYSDKRRFTARLRSPGAAALDAIYLVASGERDDPPGVRPISKRDGVIGLLRNTFVLDTEDRRRHERRLDRLSAVAGLVPVRELRVPHRFDALPDVRALLETELRGAVA